jgi:hypothetical protein
MRRTTWIRCAWIGAALLLMASGANAVAGVHIALIGPANVSPGQTFEVDLVVTQPGTLFNAYDATIAWDPARLTFQAATPLSLQEGSYMTGACGATFHWFQQNSASVSISHVMWCAGMHLPGPGQLYRLRFRAAGTAGTTQVTIAANEFYDAGYTVPTASATSASVVIGGPTDAMNSAASLRLEAVPNPFRPATMLELQAPEPGLQVISIYDVTGRLVRELDRGSYTAGPRQVAWDGRDAAGRRLAAGTYWIRLEVGGNRTTKRVVLLR